MSFVSHIKYPAKFLLSTLVVVLPVMGLLFALARPKLQHAAKGDSRMRFLWLVLVVPLLTVLLLSLVTGMRLRSMWAYPLFLPVGLWFVYRYVPEASSWHIRRFMRALVGLFLFFLLVYGSVQLFSPQFKDKGKRTHFPGKALAQAVLQQWQKHSDQPLRYIGGDVWLAGNASWYSGLDLRPSVALELDSRRSPWVMDSDLQRDGGIILWDMGSTLVPRPDLIETVKASYRKRFGTFVMGEPLRLEWGVGGNIPPVVVGWGIVPPAKNKVRN